MFAPGELFSFSLCVEAGCINHKTSKLYAGPSVGPPWVYIFKAIECIEDAKTTATIAWWWMKIAYLH